MADKQKDTPETLTPKFVLAEDFASVYANFTRFEPTLWDIKMLFGEIIEQNDQGGVVEHHTGVSMAWPCAKVMAFYLAMNVAIYERDNGSIAISSTVLQSDIRHLGASPLTHMIEEASKIRELATAPHKKR